MYPWRKGQKSTKTEASVEQAVDRNVLGKGEIEGREGSYTDIEWKRFHYRPGNWSAVFPTSYIATVFTRISLVLE